MPSQSGRPSAAPRGNGFHDVTNRAPCSKPKTHKKTAAPPAFRRTDTFWTICNGCNIHYEYLKVYLNNTLLCPNYHQPFLAAEIATPNNLPKSSGSNSEPRQISEASNSKLGKNSTSIQDIRQGGSAGSNKNSNSHSGTSNVSRTGNAEPSVAAKAANVVQQANERLKRAREESQGTFSKGEVPSKRRVVDGASPAGVGFQNLSGLHGFSGIIKKPNGTRELTLLETRNMLMGKALKEDKWRLSEWTLDAAGKTEEKKNVEQRKKENLKNGMKFDEKLNVIGESTPAKDETTEHVNCKSDDSECKEDLVALSINVPDPDFHDFDMDRTESSFGDGQVWAAYDDDDSMPRFYAFIHNVIS